MDDKKVITTKKIDKLLANVSLKFGKIAANSACCYIFHQSKVPEDLKKLKCDK